jgi:hypothetical protein
MRTKLIMLGMLISVAAHAAPLTFQFATTIDATPVGGSATAPLTVIYTFDSALADGSGPGNPVSPTLGSYGPLTMQIQIGGQTISATGGGISVFDNAGTTSGGQLRRATFAFRIFRTVVWSGRDLLPILARGPGSDDVC